MYTRISVNMALTAKAAPARAAEPKPPTMGNLYEQLERTKPGSEESNRISEKILEAIFDVGSR